MPSATAKYKNSTLPVAERVEDLLRRMTLDEKCDQLRQTDLSKLQIFEDAVSEESLERVFRGRAPGVIRIESGAEARDSAIKARGARSYLLRNTRLGIPPLFVITCSNGVAARGATIFPCALALGATWNPDLVRDMAARIATEASSIGAAEILAPSFALGRDPRFGGISQCFGECPTLVTTLGLAFLEGLQGKGTFQWLAPNKVFGTALHFTGWGAADSGLYGAPVSLSTRALRALHFPPFEDAVTLGGAQVVMPVVSPINSVPGHANGWLLDTVLRGEWHFPGAVLSAPGGVAMNSSVFGVARGDDAAAQALAAGVDIETGSDTYKSLAAAVRAKKVSESEINRAVARVLRLKFLAGLFDVRRVIAPDVLGVRLRTSASRTLARRLAAESVILLKNTDDFLPLDTGRIKNLAVIGPNADRSQFGEDSWSGDDTDGVTVLQGLRNLLGNTVRIHHARGCEITGGSRAGFPEAVAVAKRCDAVLLVLGDESAPLVGASNRRSRHSPTAGTGYDEAHPDLPGAQEALAKEIAATGRPVIVVLLSGRPCSAPWVKENATAILAMFFAGEEQGSALADILFGNLDPSGRLPVSVAEGAGSLPTNYDFTPGARGIFKRPGSPDFPGRDYVSASPGPLWPFGFGLSYARFQYSDLTVETPTLAPDGEVRLSFSVTNLSTRDGTDVAQIYFHNTTSLVAGPLLRLVRFEKFQVKAGETRRVEIVFKASAMSEWDKLVRSRVAVAGEYEILVGTSAEDIVLRGKVVLK
ncbi:MAG: glycoside hydrolase family 3 C-terminal domain-containing protein [Puniceicoccales bacterium]|jgi:beta-glucosidase|nr:glycoside hydrolase family 3 C-terminal domain-containing protein [Puniceicoccales bacterium]